MVLLWVKFGTEKKVLFPRKVAVLKGIVLRRKKSQGKWTISVVFYRCKKRSGVLERALAHAGARSAFAQRPLGTRSGRAWDSGEHSGSAWSTLGTRCGWILEGGRRTRDVQVWRNANTCNEHEARLDADADQGRGVRLPMLFNTSFVPAAVLAHAQASSVETALLRWGTVLTKSRDEMFASEVAESLVTRLPIRRHGDLRRYYPLRIAREAQNNAPRGQLELKTRQPETGGELEVLAVNGELERSSGSSQITTGFKAPDLYLKHSKCQAKRRQKQVGSCCEAASTTIETPGTLCWPHFRLVGLPTSLKLDSNFGTIAARRSRPVPSNACRTVPSWEQDIAAGITFANDVDGEEMSPSLHGGEFVYLEDRYHRARRRSRSNSTRIRQRRSLTWGHSRSVTASADTEIQGKFVYVYCAPVICIKLHHSLRAEQMRSGATETYSVDAFKCVTRARQNLRVQLVVYDTLPHNRIAFLGFIAIDRIPANHV
ncbi:hypothetical protein B0H12DRAFT_1081267 [Mycena haematopus]|nr:hypothetical protein B0H12DRAFT_1081267 [Mycena haematopus]